MSCRFLHMSEGFPDTSWKKTYIYIWISYIFLDVSYIFNIPINFYAFPKYFHKFHLNLYTCPIDFYALPVHVNTCPIKLYAFSIDFCTFPMYFYTDPIYFYDIPIDFYAFFDRFRHISSGFPIHFLYMCTSQLIRVLLTIGYVLKPQFFRPLSANSLTFNLWICLKTSILSTPLS